MRRCGRVRRWWCGAGRRERSTTTSPTAPPTSRRPTRGSPSPAGPAASGRSTSGRARRCWCGGASCPPVPPAARRPSRAWPTAVASFRRFAPALLVAAGWVAVVPLLAVALARVVAWDDRSTLVALNALTPLLYLPAWPVALGAGLGGRWWLLAAALVVVVAHVAFVAPELAARDALPASVASAPAVRLFDANVLVGNKDVAGYAAEISRARPDVVVLQEATPAFVAALDATGVLAELPNRITVSRTDPS